MYIRQTTKTVRGKTYANHLLVESVWTDKGPRQKAICSLGDLAPRSRGEWLKLAARVEEALVGQGNLFDGDDPEVNTIVRRVRARQEVAETHVRSGAASEPPSPGEPGDCVRVRVDEVRTERHREAGPVHVGHQFWRRLGLDRILAEAGLSPRACTLACAMVLNRLIHPGSEHAMPDWFKRTALSDVLGEDLETLSDESLYRMLDRLHPRRAQIESALVEREQSLFHTDATVFFYDLTSTYFEGEALKNPKAKRGHSRDKRPDCKQVVVGLVVNRDGFPLAHEIFVGNTQDRQTVGNRLDVLGTRVTLKPGQTVVVDRGMAYDDNLAEIRRRQLKYVVAARQPERDRWLAEFEEGEGCEEVIRTPSPLNACQRKSRIQVTIKRLHDADGQAIGTYILCHSEERVQKDRAIRERQEKALLKDLEQLQARVRNGRLKQPVNIGEAIGRLKERYPRVSRYYGMTYDESTSEVRYALDQDAHEKARTLDGTYLLKTEHTDISAQDGWLLYTLPTRAENAFRCMKTPLAERPIFHQVERRVDTHIFLCVLAYHLLVAIEKTLLDQGVHTSWATVRDALASHRICTVVLPTDSAEVLRIRRASTPEPAHRDCYRWLNIPEQIIHPQKTWSSHDATPKPSD
jgi:transposase